MNSHPITPADLFARGALHPAAFAVADASLGQPWCVAFSGGADSLALLHTLLALFPAQKIQLHALHFNHRLRGPASDADESFCRETCAALGVAFHSASWQRSPGSAGLPSGSASEAYNLQLTAYASPPPVSESDARIARHAFFAETMSALGARLLFTGHQLDDIAETQLMRLARGSSATGLAAPRPVQLHRDGRTFLRPLLTLRKSEILSALRAAGLSWREDSSNATHDFFRNRIRHEVLPALVAAAPSDPLAGAALTRELLDEDSAALDAWLDELFPPAADAFSGNILDLHPLLHRPRALWRRALRRWHPASALARAGFEQLLSAALAGTGQLTCEHGLLRVDAHRIVLESEDASLVGVSPPLLLTASAPLQLPDGATLTLEFLTLSAADRARILSGKVDPSRQAYVRHFQPAFTVRAWQHGDRYRPLGAPGSAKLSDLFINHKIPPARRQTLPVICTPDGSIVWIPGFPPADDEKLTDDSITVAQLTYHRGTSTVRL